MELRIPRLSPCVLINTLTSFPVAVRLAGDMGAWQPEENLPCLKIVLILKISHGKANPVTNADSSSQS